MSRLRFAFVATVAACGSSTSIDDYLPPLPEPPGGAQIASAGQVTDPSQLVTGPAQSGLVGDYFIKNDRATFIVQAPTRVIGVIPQGGNVVDAVLTDGTTQTVDDHFGELAMVYLLGRTCDPDRIEIIADGSRGGVAALRAIGKTGNDDFINLKGIGALPVDPTVDPNNDDGMQCATTYILAPGSTTLEVYHTLYNSGPDQIAGPLGTIADTGGNTEAWTNTRGFERSDITDIIAQAGAHPMDYVLYQGPGVAYGIIPRHAKPTPHTQIAVAGVSVVLDGNDEFLQVLQKDKYPLHLSPGDGLLQRYDLVVGHDASDVDAVWRTYNKETLTPISGKVTWSDGTPIAGARVGVFADGNGNGTLDAETVLDDGSAPIDNALLYMDTLADGTYSGLVPASAAFVRAEVKNVGRSPVMPPTDTVNLAIPTPLKVDFQILDHDTGMPIPGRLLVIGDHPAFPDDRVFEVSDRSAGVVTQEHAIRGTTVDIGDGSDPAIYLPANGNYRIYASRGTEWSIDSQPVTGASNVSLTFTLKRVVPTPNYLATDWHVHMLGSPDSPVTVEDRVASAVSAGVEMFAVTDHDYVSDLQPYVQAKHLESLLRVVPGMEVTPFAYGHFNCWPLVPDLTSANHGAIDWAQGATVGDAMTPGDVFAAMYARGAQMVQVNHPRATGFGEFQAAFARANIKYDYTNHIIYGDYENADVPNDYLRLPGESLWSDNFTGLEIWNGFDLRDSNGDGLRENKLNDRVMNDWLNMLSLGFYVVPAGDSDTHTVTADPLGMPRTYVRVDDDSPAALASGNAIADVLATQTGYVGKPRDVVVTDGPMIDVKVAGSPALGRTLTSSGPVQFDVSIFAADWAPFDTLEVFANSTPDRVGADDNTVLVPLKCYTTRPLASLDPKDPCMLAPLAPEAMTVSLANVSGGGSFQRYEATVSVTLDSNDVAAGTRAGATGKDAWFVFRARGDRGIFPILPKLDTVTTSTLPALLTGDRATIDAALIGHGVPAAAITAPVFVDFDGGGYKAPFAP